MKRKRIALSLLGVLLAFQANGAMQMVASAESFDDSTPFVEDDFDMDMGDDFVDDDETFIDQIDEGGVISDDDSSEISDDEEIDELSDEDDDISAPIDVDESMRVSNYKTKNERSDFFLGEDPLKVTKFVYEEDDIKEVLNKEDYEVIGYVKKSDYIETEGYLDNLSEFENEPNEAGIWAAIVQGKPPYFGRQAVVVTFHDMNDVSMYNWKTTGDIVVGENPAEALSVFYEYNGTEYEVDSEDIHVVGYVPVEEYVDEDGINANYTVVDLPETAGEWVVIFEGVGDYKGQQTGCVSVKDDKDISMYAAGIKNQEVTVDSDIENLITVARNNFTSSKTLGKDVFKIAGYIADSEFAAAEYDLNKCETIKKAPDTARGWFVVLEGTAPYYGKNIVWLDIKESKVVPETAAKFEEEAASQDDEKFVDENEE